jgi:vacuolar-type H+-ATPase subunit E/Vma4
MKNKIMNIMREADNKTRNIIKNADKEYINDSISQLQKKIDELEKDNINGNKDIIIAILKMSIGSIMQMSVAR